MEEIKKIVGELEKIDFNKLKREDQDLNFVDVHHIIIEIFDSLKYLTDNPEIWETVPENIKIIVRSQTKSFQGYVNGINTFTATRDNAMSTRNSLSASIKSLYAIFDVNLIQRIKIDKLEKRYDSGNIEDVLKKIQKNSKVAENELKRIKEIGNEIQKSSGKKGAHKFAEIFAYEAESRRTSSENWLIVSTVSVILAFGSVLLLFYLSSGLLINENFQYFYQLIIVNILVLSLFFVLVRQFIKNYNANMHLYTLNKHRDNCLRTFQLFIDSTKNSKVQDIILTQATKSIFELGETGYVNSSYQQKNSSLSDIVEILKK